MKSSKAIITPGFLFEKKRKLFFSRKPLEKYWQSYDSHMYETFFQQLLLLFFKK